MSGTRVFDQEQWMALAIAGEIDAGDIALDLLHGYELQFLGPVTLVVGTDRYAALDIVNDHLEAALSTQGGGRQGHTVRFLLREYNHVNGADELGEELRTLLTLWRIASRQPRPARRPAAA